MLEPREDFHLRGALPADLHSPHLPWRGLPEYVLKTPPRAPLPRKSRMSLLTFASLNLAYCWRSGTLPSPNHFGVGDRGRAKDGEASSNAERCPCLEHSTAWAGPTELLRACGVCLPLCTSGNIDLIHRSNFSGKPSSCCLSSTPCSFNPLLGVLDVTTESLKGFFGDGCLAQSSMADLLLAEIGDPPRLSFS